MGSENGSRRIRGEIVGVLIVLNTVRYSAAWDIKQRPHGATPLKRSVFTGGSESS